MARINDGYCVGPSVPDCSQNVGQMERSVILHEFLARHKTYLTNTWTDEVNVDHMFTERDWKERTEKGAAAQIVFVAASNSLNMTQSAVHGHTDFSSDHFLVMRNSRLVKRERESRENLPPELVPDCLLVRSVSMRKLEVDDWETCCKRLHALEAEHEEPTPNRDCDDLELTSLVEVAREAPPDSRRMFSKRIWRVRWKLRRRRKNL